MLPENGQKRIRIFICIGIVAAGMAAYEPVRHNGFVNYDDNLYITDNPDIKGKPTFKQLGEAFTKPHVYMWHPLTTLSHIADYRLFGLNPLGHHSVNVFVHIINAILLFLLLARLTKSTWASAFVAAVFAVHPLGVESVAWAAERKTVLSGLFVLLTITVYTWYAKRPSIGRYILLFVNYALCIMTKPTVVTLPIVLLLLDYWPLSKGRMTEDRGQRTKGVAKNLNLVLEKIPLLGLSGILGVITVIVQKGGGSVVTLGIIPLDSRLANIFTSYIKYIYKMLWPSGLAVFYPYPRISLIDSGAIVCLVLFIAITFLSIYAGRRRKYIATGWLWFVITLVPVIGLVQSGAQAMADRYMYLPIAGFLIIIAWTARDLIDDNRFFRYIAIAASVVIMTALVILTRAQVGYWRNSVTLWEHTLNVTKNNDVAENNYASALAEQGRINEMEPHLRKALLLNPGYTNARQTLCNLFLTQKRFNEAVDCYNELLRRGHLSGLVYYNLALALEAQEKYDEALKSLSKAEQFEPKLPDIHKKIGDLSFGTGDYKKAIENWSKAAQIEPNNASVLNNLAWVLANTKDESIRDANMAVELAERACGLTNNKEPKFLDTLAAAYASANRFEEAVKTAGKAIDSAKASGSEELARKIESRLESYKKRRPQ